MHARPVNRLLCFAIGGAFAATFCAGAEPQAKPPSIVVEVAAGKHTRFDAIVEFPIPESLRDATSFYLRQLDNDALVPVQRITGKRPRLVWIARGEMSAGSTRRYEITAVDGKREEAVAAASDSQVVVAHHRGRLTVRVGEKPVLAYHTAVAMPPKPIEAVYRRSGFVHPLFSPSGRVLTDDFPPDHAHQHGLFFAWVNTSFADHDVDFWNQLKGSGQVEHATVEQITSGPVFGEFRVKLRHLDTTETDAPRPVLDETWTVRVYNIADPFVIDFESRQSSAGSEPLVINKYHYGGLALRGNRAWYDDQAKGLASAGPSNAFSDFLTSEGDGRAEGNHTRPRWVDLHGRVGEEMCGITVLGHPANFRFPQAVRLHPSKPYFCFSPMVDESFAIGRDKPYVSRYRLLTHDGDAKPDQLDRHWQDYAEPLTALVVDNAP
ncbi:MAG: PmoA family protein [Pirellulaceae bacterium]